MRKLLYLLGGIVFGVVLTRLFRRRRTAPPAAAEPRPSTPGAEALRARLAAARAESAASAPAPAEAASDDEPRVDAPANVDDARRRVHGQARAAVDEMRRAGEA